ncbi:MAG: hypothetical protein GY940_13615 [bacterium]|nr:hypothetical protein [bacterium]
MYDSDSDYYNWIEYWSNSPNHPSPPSGEDINKDQEFPTVALDREQNVTVNWQEWNTGNRNYDIIRFQSTNSVAPTRPISTPDYEPWEFYDTGIRISTDDELFPNLAHKKVSMYTDQGKLHGITEIWTAISTFGPVAAAANTIKTFNNLIRDIAVN